MADVCDLIISDHAEFRHGFDALTDHRQEPTTLERMWAPLADLLERHAASEEATFYPALLAVDKQDPEGETKDAIGDHNKIRDAIRDAAAAETGSDAWWAAVERAREENDDHMREEEEGPLPHFRKYANDETRDLVGRAFEAGKRGRPNTGDTDPDKYVAQHQPH